MTESTPQDGAALLAKIKPRLREEVTHICLRPDLMQEYREVEDELLEAQHKDKPPGRMADKPDGEIERLEARKLELEDEIEAVDLRVVMRAMPKDEWQALCEKHPPRKGNTVDLYSGYDVDAVEDAAIRLCMISPVFADCPIVAKGEPCLHDDCGSWQAFVKVLNPTEWAELKRTVRAANQAVTETPKSRRASSARTSPAAG
jgi:hypothetical protein